MKKFTLIAAILLSTIFNNIDAQAYIKIDALFYSLALDTVKKVDIYLPSDYYEHPEQQYATIYYLHGAGGNENESNPFAQHYYSTHNENPISDSLPAAIFVAPDGSCSPYLGSYWKNSLVYGNYEEFITSDLISFIETEFRAINDKNFRFITGYSMGGHGSAYLALKNPDIFRACAPLSAAHIAYPDTLMNVWINSLYEENGSYEFNYNAGHVTELFFTASGAFSPNLNIEPHFIEMLWDTSGNMVDTVWTKWFNHDCSSLVSSIPDEEELDFYLICGTIDEYVCYPPYLLFEDSLNKYNIEYKSTYNAYLHGEVDMIANAMMWRWMDSLAYLSYQYLDINKPYVNTQEKITLYPNPVSTTTKLIIPKGSTGKVNILIYDATGNCLKNWEYLREPNAQQEIILKMHDLAQGIYFCQIKIGNEMVTKKIIKL